MRNGIFPFFTKGRVLKKESIEYLRDFPSDFVSLAYNDYSDGILFGFSIIYQDGCISISKGVIKYKGDIVIVSESNIVLSEYDRLLYIKLVFGDVTETEDYRICQIKVELDVNPPLKDNEVELGRFSLSIGAILRCEYDSFFDLRTTENTLDITHVCFAGAETATMHPCVLREFANALLTRSHDSVDFNFALLCLNTGIVHKKSIQWYIAKKNGTEYTDYNLPELYQKLADLLPQNERKSKNVKPRGRGPVID